MADVAPADPVFLIEMDLYKFPESRGIIVPRGFCVSKGFQERVCYLIILSVFL